MSAPAPPRRPAPAPASGPGGAAPAGTDGPDGAPRFEVVAAPDDEVLAACWRLAGEAPLLAPAVLRALAPPGARLLACLVRRGDRVEAALAGWEIGPPWWRRLTFPALPGFASRDDPATPACLWAGLRELARRRRAPWLELSGLHGPACGVPRSLGAVRALRWRLEPVLDLAADPRGPTDDERPAPPGDPAAARLEVTRARGALAAHHALMARAGEALAPGEAPPPPLDPAAQARLVAAGLASVVRAAGPGEAAASLLLLDAGPRPCLLGVAAAGADGRAAAARLLGLTAGRVAAAGARELLLGGVTEEAPAWALALRRARATGERPAMHLVLAAGPRWPVHLEAAWQIGRRSPARLVAAAAGRVARLERFVVHAWEPPGCRPPPLPGGVELRRLSDQELLAASVHSNALGTHRHYLERHGFNTAWGLFVEGELAHVSWVFTRAEHARLPLAHLRLADGEVELGNCVTLPRFRGRGLYPLAIGALSGLLFEGGARRVYLVTARRNVASARGIEKAGPTPRGRVSILWLPPLRRARVRREVPGMAAPLEWVDLARAFGGPPRP